MTMNRKEAEMALSAAIGQYVEMRMKDHLREDGLGKEDAFVHTIVHALEFCAGSVMTCFFLAARRGPTGGEVDLNEVEGKFRKMMARATTLVCQAFPKHLASVDELISRGERPS